ncbi:MAG: amidohydrolase family protein [Pygmaiobacter massiliensis]|nr:amidohydrolase family protein [Pygmaiobacter massiliensis]
MKIQPKDKRQLLAAAMGKINCDLAVKNVKYVNLFTGEVYPATVFVHQGFVVHVEDQDLSAGLDKADKVVDGEGRYIVPGLIDSHVHIESSMLTPRQFARAVVPHGVLAVVTDPHEIGNVFGEDAVRYMHDAGCDLPMRQFIDIPSCVPAVPGLEQAGASFEAAVVDRLAKLPNVIGLAEVMDYLGVVNGSDRMMEFLEAADRNGLYIQGHIHVPENNRRLLSAYLVGGPHSCHETTQAFEAKAKLRGGMYVDARDSSISKNVADIWQGIKDLPWRDRLCLCTDDREVDDILETGQLDDVLRHAIALGMNPIEALKACTLNPAQEAHLENLGMVAPGFTADFLLVDDLEGFTIDSVWFGGKQVASRGKLTCEIAEKHFELEGRNSMQVPELSPEDFKLKAPAGCTDRVRVNVQHYTSLKSSLTRLSCEELPVKDGCVDLSQDEDLFYAMIINRYGAGTRSFGVVRGFGAKRGADASTVSHDCHNLCIVFKDAESGYAAYRELVKCGGGICCAVDGQVKCTLPLPCGGLMSNEPCEVAARQSLAMKKALKEELGMPQENPLLRIVTLALPVAPAVKFSDLGLVDVMEQKFLPIFPDFAD